MSWFINDVYNLNAILSFSGPDYRCIISVISKNKAINLLQNAEFTKESRKLLKKEIKNCGLWNINIFWKHT